MQRAVDGFSSFGEPYPFQAIGELRIDISKMQECSTQCSFCATEPVVSVFITPHVVGTAYWYGNLAPERRRGRQHNPRPPVRRNNINCLSLNFKPGS